MSLGRPITEFEQHVCPKCGAVQESPGSTVCEQCGTDLKPAAIDKPPSQRPVPQPVQQPRPSQRLVQILTAPVRMLMRGLEALLWLVSSLVYFIWGLVSLTLRIAIALLVIGSLVVGLSYVPEVRARVPIMEEVPQIAKQALQRAEAEGARLLASWTRQPSPQRASPQRRASQPAATARKPAPARPAASQLLTVKSAPTGATVLLNARGVGKTPLTLKVKPGTYKVTISRPGYTSVTHTITVKAGKSASLNVKLAARRNSRRVVPTPPPAPPADNPRAREP